MKDSSLKGKRYALIMPSDDDDNGHSRSRSSSKHYNNTNTLLKPTVKIGNYFFVWNEDSPGIYSNEIDSFNNFIKKMIPYLEECMNVFKGNNETDKDNDNDRSSGNGGVGRGGAGGKGIKFQKMLIDKGRICISEKYNNKISFVLNVDNIGTTIFSREEHVLFVENITTANDLRLVESQRKWESDDDQKSVILKWKLGELLFDRIKSR